jgi:chromosomal replication initiator protein
MTEQQLAAIWKSIVPELESRSGIAFFKTWLKHAHLAGLQGEVGTLAVENQAAVAFIKRHAEQHIKDLLSEQAGTEVQTVEYRVLGEDRQRKASRELFTSQPIDQVPQSVPVYSQELSQPVGIPVEPIQSNLNPKYTFENFIVGSKNRLAYAAAQAVADNPGRAYNPLYFYGGVGLGKTHLMQAIGAEIIRREPQKRVVYASCESFMNEFTASIRSGKADAFKKKFRNIDVFLVDDIQFIAGKDSTQEEFFHTFNALYQTDKQIVITSDKAPGEIKGLEDRLSSRFSSGMIADMQLPDLETRQAILQAKCEERHVQLSDTVLLFIADLVETNIRELEGALSTVILHMKAEGKSASVEIAREALRSFASMKPTKKTSLEHIKQIVCEYYGTDFADIFGQRRQRELVKPRQVLMYLMKNELGMTFPTIGREIGGRDHTTAMHAVEKIEKEMKKSDELLQELTQIKELFYSSSR